MQWRPQAAAKGGRAHSTASAAAAHPRGQDDDRRLDAHFLQLLPQLGGCIAPLHVPPCREHERRMGSDRRRGGSGGGSGAALPAGQHRSCGAPGASFIPAARFCAGGVRPHNGCRALARRVWCCSRVFALAGARSALPPNRSSFSEQYSKCNSAAAACLGSQTQRAASVQPFRPHKHWI